MSFPIPALASTPPWKAAFAQRFFGSKKHGNQAIPPGEYLLAVNNTDRKLAYRITLPPLAANRVSVVGEDREAELVKGWLEDKFGPLDVHIYGPLQRR